MFIKSVTIRDGKFFSLISEGPCAIEYKIGEWVRPQFGKLFVWNVDAKFWADESRFVCEVENPMPAVGWINVNHYIGATPEEVKRFWENVPTWRRNSDTATWICDAVKLCL